MLLLITSACVSGGCGGADLQLAGTVERRALELAAPISEVIVELPVPVGGSVEAGQIVVQLDTTVATAELAAAEAAHAASEATLREAEGVFQRQANLKRSGVATQQALDGARRGRDEALALQAERAARIAQAKKRLEDLTVRAFAPGVVDQLPYDVGERPPAGGVVGVVSADEKPWIRIWLPSRVVALANANTRATVRVEGLAQHLTGQVSDIAREAAFTPHYALTERESAHLVYEAKVVLDDAPDGLRPGLPAQVRLTLTSDSP